VEENTSSNKILAKNLQTKMREIISHEKVIVQTTKLITLLTKPGKSGGNPIKEI